MVVYQLLEERDLVERVKWMNDCRIYETMHYDIPITIEKTLKWFKRNKNNTDRRDFVLEEDGVIMAMSGLIPCDCVGQVESYTFVNPSVKGAGYGTASLALHCGFAFFQWNVKEVCCFIDSNNIASRRMHLRIGFEQKREFSDEVFRSNLGFISRCYLELKPKDFNGNLYSECVRKTRISIL